MAVEENDSAHGPRTLRRDRGGCYHLYGHQIMGGDPRSEAQPTCKPLIHICSNLMHDARDILPVEVFAEST